MERNSQPIVTISRTARLLVAALFTVACLTSSGTALAQARDSRDAHGMNNATAQRQDRPDITNPSIADGDTLHGTVTVTADVTHKSRDFDGTVTLILNNNKGKISNTNMSETNDDHYAATVDTTSFETGRDHYTATISASDETTSSSVDYSIIIDNAPPNITVKKLSTSDTTPQLTGTIDDENASVLVAIDGADYTASITGSTWSAQVVQPLKPGSYTVQATATDKSTNSRTSTGKLVITSQPKPQHHSEKHPPIASATTTPPQPPSSPTLPAPVASRSSTSANTSHPLGTISNFKVMGAATNNPNQVKRLEFSGNQSKNHGTGFLVLGWWWMLVLGVLFAFTVLYRGILGKVDYMDKIGR